VTAATRPHAPFRPSAAQLALMLNNFLMWGGFFMVIPLVTVHFSHGLGWSAASVGAVLGLRQIAQQGLTVGAGAIQFTKSVSVTHDGFLCLIAHGRIRYHGGSWTGLEGPV